MPDGKHIIGVLDASNTDIEASGPDIRAILNWFTELQQRIPLK
jgi:hypothetical protein